MRYIEILSDSEYEALFTFLEECSERDRLMIRFMLTCGCRVREVSNLNIENVWRSGLANLEVYLSRSSTKGHVARYVPMSKPLRDRIELYIKQRVDQLNTVDPTSPLFLSLRSKKRIDVRSIQMITGDISKRAIGRPVRCHVLRHTFASMLAKHYDIKIVQILLGHASLSSTSVYLHPDSEDMKSACEERFSR